MSEAWSVATRLGDAAPEDSVAEPGSANDGSAETAVVGTPEVKVPIDGMLAFMSAKQIQRESSPVTRRASRMDFVRPSAASSTASTGASVPQVTQTPPSGVILRPSGMPRSPGSLAERSAGGADPGSLAECKEEIQNLRAQLDAERAARQQERIRRLACEAELELLHREREGLALAEAAAADDVGKLRGLAEGNDVNRGDNNKRTALHVAATEGHVAAVACLVDELGAKPSPLDHWDRTPLDEAVEHDRADAVALLQKRGATHGPRFATRNASALRNAAATGDLEGLRQRAPHANVNEPNYEGRTPLHLAASFGSSEAVTFLIELGADVSAADRWGNTPLDAALSQGHSMIASHLQSLGAKPGSEDAGGFAARNASAFRTAAATGNVADLRRRASHTDVNAVANYEGRTPLHLAASVGSLEAVRYLIELGADVSALDSAGNTPLDDAMRQGHAETASHLQGLGAKLGSADASGFAASNASCFRKAAATGDLEGLRQRAPHTEVNAVANYEGRTPLHLAASFGSSEAVTFLIELGADVSAADRWGNTPLDAALSQGHAEIVSHLQSLGAKPGSLGTGGTGDADGFAARNASAFRTAAATGNVDCLRRRASHTDVNAVANYEGRTPLHLAASVGSLEAVRYLIELGADLSALDSAGNTPLDDAMRQANQELVELLQGLGAYSGASFRTLAQNISPHRRKRKPTGENGVTVPLSLGESAKSFAAFVQQGVSALGDELEISVEGTKAKPAPSFAGRLGPTIVGNFSCHGAEPDQSGDPVGKTNQDCSCAVSPVGGQEGVALFCVFDGHGRHGHIVSKEALVSMHFELERSSKLSTSPAEALTAAFEAVQSHLIVLGAQKSPAVPARESGACGLVAYLAGETLTVAGAGDCRAVLASKRGGELHATNLSTDHKVDLPAEQPRLEAASAFVSPAQGSETDDDFAPARVYESKSEPWRGPGLTMSRTLGDTDASVCGVIATPEVRTHEVQSEDAFLILASDGVWEFIDSDEAVHIVGRALESGLAASDAAHLLIMRAVIRWAQVEGSYRDDITAVVIYLPETIGTLRQKSSDRSPRVSPPARRAPASTGPKPKKELVAVDIE